MARKWFWYEEGGTFDAVCGLIRCRTLFALEGRPMPYNGSFSVCKGYAVCVFCKRGWCEVHERGKG